MKMNLFLCSVLLLVSGSIASAATEQSGSVQFDDSVRVGTNNLPAGKYAIHWEAGASEVELKISGQGKKISVPATAAASSGHDEVLMHRDGATQVVEGFTVKSTTFKIK